MSAALIAILGLLIFTPPLGAVARWQMRRDARAWRRYLLQRRIDAINESIGNLVTEIGTRLLPSVQQAASAINRFAAVLSPLGSTKETTR